jgi:hypothetical protein
MSCILASFWLRSASGILRGGGRSPPPQAAARDLCEPRAARDSPLRELWVLYHSSWFAQAFTCAKPLRQAQRRSQWGDARARLLGRKASHHCSDARARLSLPHLPAPSCPVCQRHSLCSRTSAWLSAAMLTVCAATAALPTCGSAPRPCCAVAQPCRALATAARLQKRVSHRGARV